MPNQILFDRLIYIDQLKRASISDDHARAHADALHVALGESVATKHDLKLLRRDLKIQIGVATVTQIAVLSALITGIKFLVP
jgi:hypothetical protein